MNIIPAYKKGKALIAEINSLRNEDQHCHIWWLGQSGFLVQWMGHRLLFDPYLSDSLTKKYADTDKPHVRMSELVVNPALLKGIDLLVTTHNHSDHLDPETLIPILKNNILIKFVIPEANREFIAKTLDCSEELPLGMNDDSWPISIYPSVGFDDYPEYRTPTWRYGVHGIAAKHNEIERDEEGYCKCMGFVIEIGPFKIYHAGDTLLYDGMVERLRPLEVDIAFLPINGDDPSRKVAGNLNCAEAAQLGKDIGAKLVIPCHYDMFEFNTADVQDFVREAEKIGQPYRVLRLGERHAYPLNVV